MDKLAVGHNFRVFIGSLEIAFSKISGIEQSLEVQEIQEGGNPRAVFLYAPKRNAGRLKFEHGTGRLNKASKAFNAAFNMQTVEGAFRGSGIILAIRNGEIARAYEYRRAIPVSWSLSGFDAETGSLLIDTVELMHNGIYEIPH